MREPSWTIYCHIHRESGRRYVGITKKTWRQRWNRHIYSANRETGRGWSYFANAIRKYGKDSFDHEVLEICSSLEEANEREQHWIWIYGTRNPLRGFNLAPGGASEWSDPRSTCDKLSAATKKSMTEERRVFLSSIRKGKPLSNETRAKISSSAKKNGPAIAERNKARGPEYFKMLSAAGRRAMTTETYEKIAKKTRNPSLETRVKLAEASRGRDSGPETKAKLALAFKGKTHGLETRAKLAEAARRQKRDSNGRYVLTKN